MMNSFSQKAAMFLVIASIALTPAITLANDTPAPIGIGLLESAQYPDVDSDIMGLRFSFLYGRNANVSGLDFGLVGCGVDGNLFGGQLSLVVNNIGSSSGALQMACVANNCLEDFYGIQMAVVANKTDGDVYGGQLALFDLANTMSGIQLGIYNQAETAIGIQLGLINVATDMKGIQLGLFNIIKNGPCPFLPLINANF